MLRTLLLSRVVNSVTSETLPDPCQGDGVDWESIPKILEKLKKDAFSLVLTQRLVRFLPSHDKLRQGEIAGWSFRSLRLFLAVVVK